MPAARRWREVRTSVQACHQHAKNGPQRSSEIDDLCGSPSLSPLANGSTLRPSHSGQPILGCGATRRPPVAPGPSSLTSSQLSAESTNNLALSSSPRYSLAAFYNFSCRIRVKQLVSQQNKAIRRVAGSHPRLPPVCTRAQTARMGRMTTSLRFAQNMLSKHSPM